MQNPSLAEAEVKSMEARLKKIEREVEEMKREVEKEKRAKSEKTARLEVKKRKEKHWEMLRWVVAYLDHNKGRWNELQRKRKDDEEKQKEFERWRELNQEGRKSLLEKKPGGVDLTREERLQLAKRKKEDWKRWREAAEEKEEDEMMEDWIQEGGGFCDFCAMTPCCCCLLKVERKIRHLNDRQDKEGGQHYKEEEEKMKKEEGEGEGRSGRKRSRTPSWEETPSKKMKRKEIIKKGKLSLLLNNHPQEQETLFNKKQTGKGSGQYDQPHHLPTQNIGGGGADESGGPQQQLVAALADGGDTSTAVQMKEK